jgi:hypothetical protein
LPGFAIAILKVGAWLNLVFGVGMAMALSVMHAPPPAPGASAPPAALPEYARVLLELGCAFEGFTGWALMLAVATIADQVERLLALANRSAEN